jgi:radical SAM-linked protein
MIRQKVEIRFEKGEAIRFISHHDLMRAIMRAVRRAKLPVRLTEGFNPRPRIVFPVALEVGVASLDEVAEIEFTQCLAIEEVSARLSSAFPQGLVLKTVKELPPRRAGQTPRLIRYLLHLKEAAIAVPPEALAQMLAQTTLPFQRPREDRIQDVDLRAGLVDLRLETAGDLVIDVAPSQKGSVRPLEILSLLLKKPLAEVKGVRITKLLMELLPPPELSEEAQAEREMLLERERERLDLAPAPQPTTAPQQTPDSTTTTATKTPTTNSLNT